MSNVPPNKYNNLTHLHLKRFHAVLVQQFITNNNFNRLTIVREPLSRTHGSGFIAALSYPHSQTVISLLKLASPMAIYL